MVERRQPTPSAGSEGPESDFDERQALEEQQVFLTLLVREFWF